VELGPLSDDIDLRSGASLHRAVPGTSMELAAARMTAILGPCRHTAAEPVQLLDDGDTVAWLCPDCDTQLPADWAPAPAPPQWPLVPELPPFAPGPRPTARTSE
jgi:hypothetical protein